MHILILVFFNSPHGGLHENVLSTVNSLLKKKNSVTVVCKPGEFANNLKRKGVGVIETSFATVDFNSIISSIEELHISNPISLIHSHPFNSRKVAVIASRLLGIPLITTVHGSYVDEIPETSSNYQSIVVVSKGIGTFLEDNGLKEPEKIFVSPNFPPKHLLHQKRARLDTKSGQLIIALVSRLDKDKSFILDIFLNAVSYAEKVSEQSIHWLIVGDGGEKTALCKKLDEICDKSTFEFTGWQEGEMLYSTYRDSDIVIAPGRCALEAMACGKATIAIGSKGYVGLINHENWQQGVYSNFGGLGKKSETYNDGAIERDLDLLLSVPQARMDLGRLGFKIVQLFYDEEKISDELLNLYQLVSGTCSKSVSERANKRDFLELCFTGANAVKLSKNKVRLMCHYNKDMNLEFAWYIILGDEVIEKVSYSNRAEVDVFLSKPGAYTFKCFVKNGDGNKVSFRLANCRFYNDTITDINCTSSDVTFTASNRKDSKAFNHRQLTSVSDKLDFNSIS